MFSVKINIKPCERYKKPKHISLKHRKVFYKLLLFTFGLFCITSLTQTLFYKLSPNPDLNDNVL